MFKIAIIGYGNLGKGVEKALLKRKDAKIVGVFTRRNPNSLQTRGSKVYHIDELWDKKSEIDICILCGGSAHDLPEQSPAIAKYFNIVDSYDNHALIKNHQENVGKNAEKTTAIISVGWDPGLFSLQRLYAEAILGAKCQTFWGEGVSQGHSDALRRLKGVSDAVQITVPLKEAMDKARMGEKEIDNKHKRVCYVVAENSDQKALEEEIKNMPHYFAPYETEVHFVSQQELIERFPDMPHGGFVIGSDNDSTMEFSLKLNSNPQFTAQVLVAYAFACVNMHKQKIYGAYNVFDVAPKYLMGNRYDIL